MVRRDAIVAALALAFGAVALYESSKLPFGTVHQPGQGFFPWWTSIVLNLLALVLLVQGLTSRPSAAREAHGRAGKVVSLLAVLGAYTLLLDPVGYLLCTFLLVLFMLRATDPQRWAVAVSVSAIAAVGSYVIFAIWLSIPLPRGTLLG